MPSPLSLLQKSSSKGRREAFEPAVDGFTVEREAEEAVVLRRSHMAGILGGI